MLSDRLIRFLHQGKVSVEKTGGNPKWVEYIQSRVERAKQWREEMPTHEQLAKKNRYVRILGKSFRAISIHTDNPCGRLINKDSGKEVVGSPSIKTAIQSVHDAYTHDHENDYRPNSTKTEHKIQAFLIRHALMNGQKLHGILTGFDDELDELIFVTDELSTGELRADVIALGGKNGRYFPVFIELKVKRELKRLMGQLEGAQALMNIAGQDFIKMLSAASGIPNEKISFDGYRLMIVWPPVSGGKEANRVEEARSKGFLFAEYSQQADAGYEFKRN